MRMKVQVKFYNQQGDLVREAAKAVGLSVEDFCRQAVLTLIVQANKKAEELNAQKEEDK